jgi:hypothetical protein
MYLGKRGPRPKRSSSSLALEPYWRRFRDYCRVEWWTGTRHCADSRLPRVAECRRDAVGVSVVRVNFHDFDTRDLKEAKALLDRLTA